MRQANVALGSHILALWFLFAYIWQDSLDRWLDHHTESTYTKQHKSTYTKQHKSTYTKQHSPDESAVKASQDCSYLRSNNQRNLDHIL